MEVISNNISHKKSKKKKKKKKKLHSTSSKRKKNKKEKEKDKLLQDESSVTAPGLPFLPPSSMLERKNKIKN
ncbi:hypothetical protein EXN66_Car005132 [Channa argus]|uniref:Uncharacterized protein n=1 Tax=Channa argus TaxID=215402 RepID=A0A6G1PGN0_CHAAH|nr:hypothetical protein EXN66_Car005132 [Channa argus]